VVIANISEDSIREFVLSKIDEVQCLPCPQFLEWTPFFFHPPPTPPLPLRFYRPAVIPAAASACAAAAADHDRDPRMLLPGLQVKEHMSSLAASVPDLSPVALDLLLGLLDYDPSSRIDAEQALV